MFFIESSWQFRYDITMKKTISIKNQAFKIILEKDKTGGYVVINPSLAGCYSQGETIEEALKNIKEVTELCLKDDKLNKSGIQITIPRHKTIKPGLLRRILKDANLTIKDLRNL